MRRIRSKDTKPELIVRSLAHRIGYRFRLHRKDLPGNPDLVFSSRRKVIFVHGCFWHQHPEKTCLDSRLPKSNKEYWHEKLARNIERDKTNVEHLSRLGYEVLTIWECETKDQDELKARLIEFLS